MKPILTSTPKSIYTDKNVKRHLGKEKYIKKKINLPRKFNDSKVSFKLSDADEEQSPKKSGCLVETVISSNKENIITSTPKSNKHKTVLDDKPQRSSTMERVSANNFESQENRSFRNPNTDSIFSSSEDDEEGSKLKPHKQTFSDLLSKSLPTKLKASKLDFISSLMNDVDDKLRDPEAVKYRNKFKSLKEELSAKIFKIYNEKAFNNKLDHNTNILWSKTLNTTAGQCLCDSLNTYPPIHIVVRIDLAVKILMDTEQLLTTLVHEMCHGVAHLSFQRKIREHGPEWKMFTHKAHIAFPSVPISSRCHNYEIPYKFEYWCLNCQFCYKRHSKSINLKITTCGICNGKFTLKYRNGKVIPEVQNLKGFSKFVKENYSLYRVPRVSHAEAMQKLSEVYKKEKEDSQINSLSLMLDSFTIKE